MKPITIEAKKYFTREGMTREILEEVIDAIPPKTTVYIIGGAARNAVYYELFKKTLPQRDFDMIVHGNMNQFVVNLRKCGFVYGKIRRKHQLVLKKKTVPKPTSIQEYIVLDMHDVQEPSPLKNLEQSSGFTINGFAIPLRHYLDTNIKKHVVALPGAMEDIKARRLRLNLDGYKGHPHLFAALRFMSLGFKQPTKEEVSLLLAEFPKIKMKRFDRNVKKALSYVGGEEKARKLLKKIGVTENIFDEETVLKMRK